MNWETVSSLATGAGTLVLVIATFASVRSANRAARVAEQSLMENLRPRERKVLDLRFGLTGHGTHSLRQIGHLLRISKERVRQIQNRALEKLRASAERVGWEPSLLLG